MFIILIFSGNVKLFIINLLVSFVFWILIVVFYSVFIVNIKNFRKVYVERIKFLISV